MKATLPNIPSEKVPVGKDEKSNKVIFESKIKKRNAKVKPHWEILDKIVDESASSTISGSRFVVYKDLGAVMMESLKNMMIDYHRSNGYTLYSAPVIVNTNILYGTGQLPKFKDDLYQVEEDKYLIPTAEATLTNIFREKILDSSELPKKLVAYSNCFRKEAGASGKDTRGIKRLHQFNKVELVHILEEKDDEKLLNEMLNSAIEIVKMLELPYRVLSLSTGELTFSSSITYDIEVWMPGQNEWMEISSVSSCSDFQGERINTRTRDGEGKSFVYTHNGSGIAIDRAIAAILENHQNEEGEINIPASLQKYMKVDKI
ncbi:MAG: serine--tRNA ligase [Mycoplasmataceae bacterium]|nr:serine--tRNA ligase [Mycoplasmataceae bacterium]